MLDVVHCISENKFCFSFYLKRKLLLRLSYLLLFDFFLVQFHSLIRLLSIICMLFFILNFFFVDVTVIIIFFKIYNKK